MSVKITYEYVCDLCTGPVRETHHYEWTPGLVTEWPRPAVDRNLCGAHHVCPVCMTELDLVKRQLFATHHLRPDE